MKKNKALKRLRKIETMILDVAKRFSPKEPHVRELLQHANAAITRVMEAASLQTSAATGSKEQTAGGNAAANGRRKSRGRKTAAAPAVPREAKRAPKKSAPKRKRTAAKRAAAKTTAAPAHPVT
jgi:hypothetical protein